MVWPLLLVLLCGSPASAADLPPSGRGGAMMTLGVHTFMALEQGLLQAAQADKPEALEALLDQRFEARDARHPDQALDRARWLAAAQGEARQVRGLSHMAVHDHRDWVMVSFQQERRTGPPHFVVDIWRRTEGAESVLMLRYVGLGGVSSKSPPVDPRR